MTSSPLLSTLARATALVSTLLGLVAGAAGPVRAEPVRTLLLAYPTPPEQRTFAEHLTLLWRGANQPTTERLALELGGEATARLRLVERGRGDFTPVTSAEAARLLPARPALSVLGVLWPELLHAVTAGPDPQTVGLPLTASVRVTPGAGYAFDALVEWSLDKPEQLRLLGMAPPLAEQTAPFAGLDGDVLLFSAPAPLAALSEALAAPGSRLRLVPFSGRLVEDFKLIYPWLQSVNVARGAYPAMSRNMVLPARYLVLVGRLDLPGPTVAKLVRTLYKKGSAVGEDAPLLAGLEAERNALFGKLLRFHAEAARAYGLDAP